MEAQTFAAILFAAALHAGWNAIVKGGSDTLLTMMLVTTSAAFLAAVSLPFLAVPASASWPFIAISSLLQAVYFMLVAQAYRVADMSLIYPLMRGMAPLLVVVGSAGWIGERLSPQAYVGTAVICAGILSMMRGAHSGLNKTGMAMAWTDAIVIASYTLIDGTGIRRSAAPLSYTLWVSLLTGLMLGGWALATRRALFVSSLRRRWRLGIGGGAATVGSYAIALWAMTKAPVAIVAALRETSILFGTAFSALLLREQVGRARIIGSCLVMIGALLLRSA